MSRLQNLQRRLSQGISGWLLFEFNCNRGDLFNEKYLSYPVGAIVSNLTLFQTCAELNHPKGNPGVRGRPLQVDFVIIEKYKTTKWLYAFESKWIGNTEISIIDILWDLIRLQNIFSNHPDVKCYFILAGFDKKMKKLFETFDIISINNTRGKKFISSTNTTLKFHLEHLSTPIKLALNEKLTSYQNFELFSLIECKKPHLYPNGSENINMTFSTCVFEVLKPNARMKIRSL